MKRMPPRASLRISNIKFYEIHLVVLELLHADRWTEKHHKGSLGIFAISVVYALKRINISMPASFFLNLGAVQ
jgi:hypothetical protein